MARINHAKSDGKSKNPSTKFFEWKSNDRNFGYYDKSSETKNSLDLPLKFAFLQHYHTIKGWHDQSRGGIWSNEVYYIGSEPLTVSCKSGVIAQGIYKDIKPQVLSAGGKYRKSVYGVDDSGNIINLQLKGSTVKAWSEFFDENKSSLEMKWINVDSFEELKKGMVEYTVPKFTLGEELTLSDAVKVDDASDVFQDYIDDYFARANEDSSESVNVHLRDVSDQDLY
jgi:hypothetical protein